MALRMFSATKLQVATYLFGVCPFSIAFLVFLNSSVSFVVTDLIGREKGVGDAVGSLGFADELLALLACPAWGLLSDRIGVRYVCVMGYAIICLALILFVQAHNVYPQLLLGRLLFSLGGAAASTMVTAVLPTVASQPETPKSTDRQHISTPSIVSDTTITPRSFNSKDQPTSSTYASSSRVAGFVGMFTGCGALIALLVFLPLPARFQTAGQTPEMALKYSFYIVAAVALVLSIWCFLGLRKLRQEKQDTTSTNVQQQVISTWHNLVAALEAGFTRSDIALGYLGGFVARASSVGISLFIPLLVNAAFLSSHLCTADSTDGLPSLKRKCPRAYVVAAEMTGICETVALIAAPIFGYAASKTPRRGLPMMVASAAGVVGYVLFPTQFDADDRDKGKRALAFVAVCFIGISQIGAIVSSLGVLSSGVLASQYSSANEEEREALLGQSSKPQSLSKLKGSVAGIYSFYGGAAILILTKLGGSLFDKVSIGAPFYIMATFNAILFIACCFLGLRKQPPNN